MRNQANITGSSSRSSNASFIIIVSFLMWMYQLCAFVCLFIAPFGHYKPLIISVFVRGYWYLLTLKLTHSLTRTDQMTPKQSSGTYCYPIHFVCVFFSFCFVFNYPFRMAFIKCVSIGFLNSAHSFHSTPKRLEYSTHEQIKKERNPTTVLSLLSAWNKNGVAHSILLDQ